MAGQRPIGLVAKRRAILIIKVPHNTNCFALPAVDFAGSDAYPKHDAWTDDMDIAVLADGVEQETTIKVDETEHGWAGLRSSVADDSAVVGFDAAVLDFSGLLGRGAKGS